MDKLAVTKKIIASGLIAVIRAASPDQALSLVDAIRQGGGEVIEVTMTVPGALRVIEKLVAGYPPDQVLIGAGTVLDAETARMVMLAGAEFVVSPCLCEDVVRMCHRYRKVVMPGAMTVGEVVRAMETGADMIKLFPGNVLQPGMVRAVRGPLPHAVLVPTGGVSLDNVQQWFKAGAAAVGVGTELTMGARNGDYRAVTETTRSFLARIREARTGQ